MENGVKNLKGARLFPKTFQIIVEINLILYDIDIKDKRGNRRVQGRDKDTRSKNRDRI
jgi:hypothetical protein